jgi:hypothetical protein
VILPRPMRSSLYQVCRRGCCPGVRAVRPEARGAHTGRRKVRIPPGTLRTARREIRPEVRTLRSLVHTFRSQVRTGPTEVRLLRTSGRLLGTSGRTGSVQVRRAGTSRGTARTSGHVARTRGRILRASRRTLRFPVQPFRTSGRLLGTSGRTGRSLVRTVCTSKPVARISGRIAGWPGRLDRFVGACDRLAAATGEILCPSRQRSISSPEGKLSSRSVTPFQHPDQCVAGQNCAATPACLRTALAVWRDLIWPSTTKRRCVMGLNQISWSPLPWRSNRQPWAASSFLSCGVKDEAIHEAILTSSWRWLVSSKEIAEPEGST